MNVGRVMSSLFTFVVSLASPRSTHSALLPVVGFPAAIQVNHGSEFVARDLDLVGLPTRCLARLSDRGSRPTMPSSSRSTVKFRIECLNAHWFMRPTMSDDRNALEKIQQGGPMMSNDV